MLNVQEPFSFCAGTKGAAGEIWLRSYLVWKLPNRVRLAKLWVQDWMAKMFPSCVLHILQNSLLCFTQLFSDFSEKNSWSGKWHSKPGWMTFFKGPLKTLLHVIVGKKKLKKLFYKAFCFLSSLPGSLFSGKPGLESHRKEKSSSFGCSGDKQTAFSAGTCLVAK